MKYIRALVPTIAAVALLATGCSSDPTADPEETTTGAATACAAPGDASEAVAVSGEFGEALELTSDVPINATELQRSVLIEGTGSELEDGAAITATITMFNGTSGEAVESYPDVAVINSADQLVEWAYEAVRCSAVGQRDVVTVPASDAFAEGIDESGFTADDTLIVVVDVTAVQPGTLAAEELLSRAEGEAVEAPEGFPEVTLADDGTPTITIPEGVDPPTELSIATLIEGDGEEVQEGDRVYVHYRGVIWDTGEDFDSSWSLGEPANFLTTGVIGGFADALVGQTVGSQVISVVPADVEEGGYGADQLVARGFEEDDVMVFVLDILGTVHAD